MSKCQYNYFLAQHLVLVQMSLRRKKKKAFPPRIFFMDHFYLSSLKTLFKGTSRNVNSRFILVNFANITA